MKALSGYAEWFWLMAKNIKPVENRGWSLYRYIKPMDLPISIYLHASKTKTPYQEIDFIRVTLNFKQRQEFDKVGFDALRGKIIGEIIITGQVTAYESDWYFGPFGFLVKNGVLYKVPVPCRGKLGFFEPDIKARFT